MAKEYSLAPEVQGIAEKLIQILKPHLEAFEIRYVLASENPKKDGREVTGLARKVVGLNAYLAGRPEGFFVLETGKPAFDALTPSQQIAYVHHELCHFGADEESGNLAIIPHDIEEFAEVAGTHGSYTDGLVLFGNALKKGDEETGTRDEIIEKILVRI